jgi:hypothetical protein
MFSLARRTVMPTLILAGLLVGGPAPAAGPEINDEGHFFKPETVSKAEAILRNIEEKHHQDVVIETYETPPEGEAKAKELAAASEGERAKYFSRWLIERARAEKVSGVYIHI